MCTAVSIIIPTHNPRRVYLERVLKGLKRQTLPIEKWELVIVDNASTQMWGVSNARIVREERLGLTYARVRGFQESQGEIVVMVDDDNVLKPDYLERAVGILEKNPQLGAVGGKALPEFEIEPPEWLKGRPKGLGLRDLGEGSIIYPKDLNSKARGIGDGGLGIVGTENLRIKRKAEDFTSPKSYSVSLTFAALSHFTCSQIN